MGEGTRAEVAPVYGLVIQLPRNLACQHHIYTVEVDGQETVVVCVYLLRDAQCELLLPA